MKHFFSFLILSVIILTANPGFSQKIYQWRGENRNGIYNETNLLIRWPENGPELLWSVESIGKGFAAPVVTNKMVLLNGEMNNTSYLFAFDLNGKQLWKSPNGNEFTGSGYASGFPGARSTPTVFGDIVYSMSGIGRLACYELATGKEKWAIDMIKDLGGQEEEFGFAESPLIDGDIVYCTPGGLVNNLVALNRFTGKTIWKSPALSEITSFCSPLLVNLPARKIIVTMMRHHIIGLDAKNGEQLWSQKIENYKYDGDHCNTPVYADGYLFYSTAEENGNGLVKLKLSPDGKKVEEIWRNKNARNAFGGFVKEGNHIFLTTDKKSLIAVEIDKGQEISSLKPNSGSLIFADGLMYCYNDNGDVKLIRFGNNKLEEISRFKISKGTKEHFSHPVISNGVLFIRHGNALMAYNIRSK